MQKETTLKKSSKSKSTMTPNTSKNKLISMSKSELAWQYSPNSSQNSALNRLSRWIKGDRDLYQALLATGYRDNQHILNVKQIAIIYEYLGEPC